MIGTALEFCSVVVVVVLKTRPSNPKPSLLRSLDTTYLWYGTIPPVWPVAVTVTKRGSTNYDVLYSLLRERESGSITCGAQRNL